MLMNVLRLLSGFIVIFFLTISSHGAEMCLRLFLDEGQSAPELIPAKPEDFARLQTELLTSDEVYESLMREMKKTSNDIKDKHKTKVLELDHLCIGAGPQCAAASLVLGRTASKSMVLEKSDLIAKTFAEKDFYINSTETNDLTMHEFPGGIGSLANFTAGQYALSTQLATYIQVQQYASNVPVLFGTAMLSAKIIKKNSQQIVEVTTDQGIVIHTKKLLLGTGLGEVGTKVTDINYANAFRENLIKNREAPDKLQPIMSADALLVAVKLAKEMANKLKLPKNVIVIGNGDGSRIAIESFHSAAVEIPKDFRIFWIGNSYQSSSQYVLSQEGWSRYVQIIPSLYEAGYITGKPGHVSKWTQEIDGTMSVTSRDKITNEQSVVYGDLIIDATGYDSSVQQILEMLNANSKLVDVTGPLPELNLVKTVLARQATDVAQNPLPVYAIGSAAGSLATKPELSLSPNGNPVAIFNTVSRTSMFMAQLLGLAPDPREHGARAERPLLKTAEQIIQEAKTKRDAQEKASKKIKRLPQVAEAMAP